MNKEGFKHLMNTYGRFIARHPFIILGIAVLMTIVAGQLQATLDLVAQSDSDFLPEDRPVIVALEKIGDEFGGLNTLTVVCEVAPTIAGSNEIRDSIDPRMVSYAYTLHKKILSLEEVSSVNSASSLLRDGNDGVLPNSIERSRDLWKKDPGLSRYISEDHTLLLIKADILPDINEEKLYNNIDAIISETSRPPGVNTFMVGQIPQNVEIDRVLSPDMARVMGYSFMGISIVVLVVMGSIVYGILPIFTIIFGTTWSMGMWAALGQDLSANTSGVSSMIMGIGIDFGIQTINRFRQEMKNHGMEKALGETFANVVFPMSTTTIAALIGFQAMSMGELKPLADMARIMSLGVFGCYLAAITVVPSLMIIYLKHIQTIKILETPKKWIKQLRKRKE